MATPLEALKQKRDLYQTQLRESPTAYANNVQPTSSDLKRAASLTSTNKAIETLKSQQIRNKWYGAQNVPAEAAQEQSGLFMKTLRALQKPLNAIAGTAQYALGDGTDSSYVKSVNKAMKSGLTFGNILQQKGAPRAVSIPLGFALDVMFDPVNWATVGTEALIPRIGVGLIEGTAKSGSIKGGLEVAKAGLESGLARKATSVMKAVPFTERIAVGAKKVAEKVAAGEMEQPVLGATRKAIIEGSTKFTDFVDRFGAKAAAKSSAYDDLIGKSIYDKLGKGIFGTPSGAVGKAVESAVNKIPSVSILGKQTPKGEDIVKFFKYSPQEAARVRDVKDVVKTEYADLGLKTASPERAMFKTIEEFKDPSAIAPVLDKAGKPVLSGGQPVYDSIWQKVDSADAVLKKEFKGNLTIADNKENARALLEMANKDFDLKDLEEAYKFNQSGRTGVQWYDRVLDRLETTTLDDLKHFRLGSGNVEEKAANMKIAMARINAEAADSVRKWNFIEKAKAKVTEKMMYPLEALLVGERAAKGIFKLAKVPMNLASHVIANLGNITMAKMFGIPVESAEFRQILWETAMAMRGRTGTEGLKQVFLNELGSMREIMEKNPTRFQAFVGESAGEVMYKINKGEAISAEARELTPKTIEEAASMIEKKFDEIMEESERQLKIGQLSVQKTPEERYLMNIQKKEELLSGLSKLETPSQLEARLAKEGVLTSAEKGTGFYTNEIDLNMKVHDALKEYFGTMAKEQPYNPVYRAGNAIVNSMPRWYEQIDQTYKTATTNFLSRVGLNEQNLIIANRSVPISAKDIASEYVKNGQKYYRLKPLKASEMAMEIYMDYSAMPDAVRVLRALPVVGSPFFSFPYAMAVKTGKTMIHNPAVFNKIGFMMNEITGVRTPEEKAAMNEKYNQYLKSPTIVRLFGKWNTDVRNWIPYYQMNMFNPSERKYDDSFQGKMLRMSDKFPILQDPVGQIIKDYILQPWILSGTGQVPQGQFGQPLYPTFDEAGRKIDAGLGTRAFYAARTLGEAYVPGSFGLAGPLFAGLPPEVIEYLPSYGLRSSALAAQGRSSVGAMTKEDAMVKGLRSWVSKAGIPLYTLDTTKTSLKK